MFVICCFKYNFCMFNDFFKCLRIFRWMYIINLYFKLFFIDIFKFCKSLEEF